MDWTPEAEEAIIKVPFFVRKKVRARVEDEARQRGRQRVTLTEVEATRKRFLTGMKSEVKGYQLDACFGPSGCPHAVGESRKLAEQIEVLLKKADFLGFLKSKGIEDLKFHHEFRVTVADCPNACSQPQIKDIGVLGARRPGLSGEPCTACEACMETCREAAIEIDADQPAPVVDMRRCLGCGACIPVCPTGTLAAEATGYRIQLGGKLGRHPQLARELPGIYDEAGILEIIAACIDLYKARSRRGERLGQLLTDADFEALTQQFKDRPL
jgi:anaerobic sulfite reductase subunit C